MADFVAVIKRAVDGLAENRPEMRARVYEKARAAVRRQLENMTPRPPEAAIEAQLAKLEDAIEMVEAENAPPFDDELVFDDLSEPVEEAPPPAAEPAPVAAVEPEPAEPVREEIRDDSPIGEPEPEPETAPGPQPESEPLGEISAEHAPAEPQETEAPAPTQADEQAAAERTAKVGATPVPFGSYAIGRAPSFPMPPREPVPMRTETEGFMPSRYQAGFGRLERPAGTPPAEAVQPIDMADIPPAEHVASTELTEEAPADDRTEEPRQAEEATVAAAALPAAEQVEDRRIVHEPVADEQLPEEAFAEAEPERPEPVAANTASDADPRWEPQEERDEDANAEFLLFEEELRRSEAELAQSHEPGGISPPRESAEEHQEAAPEPAPARTQDETFGFDHRDQAIAGVAARAAQRREQQQALKNTRRGGWNRIAIAAAVLLVLIGAGFAAWSNQDRLVALFGGGAADQATPTEAPGEDVAAVAPEDAAPEEAGVQKFTQRLLPSGREVDEGPSETASAADAEEEGRSLALQSEAAQEAPAAAAPATGETLAEEDVAAAAGAEEAPVEPAIGVAETMFLYEERQGDEGPTALEGSVVWTLVEEPPIQGEAPEPAIRGDITVPDNDFTARVTIRRNADPSLPASHLIELVFSLPEEFGGGGIETVRRVAFKETEQDRGNELIAVPARITDDFFMVALNDYEEAVQANLQLMGEREWIDIPIVYENDRRALITLNKGTTGTQVFDEALTAWRRMNRSSSSAPAATPGAGEEAPAEDASGG